MQILLVNHPQDRLPKGTDKLIQDIGWTLTTVADYQTALDAARAQTVDVVLLPQPEESQASDQVLRSFLRLIDAQRIATFLVADDDGRASLCPKGVGDVLDRNVSLAELRGRFAMIERYHKRFRRMEQEIRNMERLGKRLNHHFRELDQEMRLAARLQRDFLPDIKKPIGNIQFATIYRPASWVSGDIFDVFRIDEEHTAFYVADAVGHGVAASLLTMFIKRSVVFKRVEGSSYSILDPAETMAILNDSLVDQALPNCQFVTACYGVINHRTLMLQHARAGHPYPILMPLDGTCSELKSTGALLGLFKDEVFETTQTQLEPGDKLFLYTDGVELAFQRGEDAPLDTVAYLDAFRAAAAKPLMEALKSIEAQLDDEAGSLSPRDDITIVGLEVLRSE